VNCYPFIEAENAGNHNVKRACELLQVSRSAYYADRASGPSLREQRDAELTAKIIEIHDESTQTYGSPRVHHELLDQGERCSRKRVVRLMRAADRHGRVPRRWKKTTIADPGAAHRPDLVGRDFGIDPDQPRPLNARWCGDITYIHTWQGWLYLATVIDLASRRVVGWAVADHLRTDLIADALTDAVNRRRPAPGVLFHSDRGCQGGFNWSSQHLDGGGVDGQACGMDAGVDGQGADEVAGQAVASPRRGAVVLA
jgi:transposase InsO family protein